MMKPVLIRIPEEEYELYKELAREKGISVAEFLRKSARKVAKVKVKKSKKYSIFDLGTKIVFKGGPKDGAVNHDKYYYEFEERKMKKYFDKYFKKKKSSTK